MLVFWDIDGTLLTTGRAGIYAWQDALREVSGAHADLESFDTAGHPDHGIARRLLVEHGGMPDPAVSAVRGLVERYEHHLPDALPRRVGRVLPNVREILEGLSREPGARCLLLTGNTRRGARAKLADYRLAAFFSDGAFSDGEGDRIAIARAALARVSRADVAAAAGSVFVVGDTPHDVRCGQAIGARTVAVATGGYEADRLKTAGAWRTLPQLPPVAEFLAMLGDRELATDV
ncbi:MAG: haloacid dehalogenase-like hydrolase [Gemmatimonadales bacterium]|nr:haloacid dehalogenase-like hydrolase [Gemmatimonadales bacterium]